jgi:hypothetical protein
MGLLRRTSGPSSTTIMSSLREFSVTKTNLPAAGLCNGMNKGTDKKKERLCFLLICALKCEKIYPVYLLVS